MKFKTIINIFGKLVRTFYPDQDGIRNNNNNKNDVKKEKKKSAPIWTAQT